MTSDPHSIVDKLTEAQRKWLPSFTREWQSLLPIGLSRRTREALIALGLIETLRPAAFGMVKFRLTPLGEAVRSILEGDVG
jgi:hypothetical protein